VNSLAIWIIGIREDIIIIAEETINTIGIIYPFFAKIIAGIVTIVIINEVIIAASPSSLNK